jgi:RNA polymerase sigma-70 factor (ECF subfamily)
MTANETEPTGQRPGFATTRWTRVLASRGSSPESKRALRELCECYYVPVETFIRHVRRGADDATDLTHDFFARILAGHAFENVERDKGRFRSYLLGAVRHFLADIHDQRQSMKRGSGHVPLSLDAVPNAGNSQNHPGGAFSIADPNGFPPDAFFDRAWALQILERVLSVLFQEQKQAGNELQFELLRPSLTGNPHQFEACEIANRLGVSDGALKVIIHRLRKRFRQLVKSEIAETVNDPAEIDSEIDYLIEALSTPAS